MTAITLKALRGIEGEVTVPALGVLIGEFQKWSLTRSEDSRSKESVFVLRAGFSHINRLLWDEPSLTKKMVVRLTKDKLYRLEQAPGSRTELQGSSLYMEGVSLWPEEQP